MVDTVVEPIDDYEFSDDLGETWHSVYAQGIVQNEYRNNVIAKVAAQYSRRNMQTLILVRELYHGDQLTQLIRAEGVKNVSFVYGDTPDNVLDDEVAHFKEHTDSVLIASPIFDEGVDVPDMRALIIADGGKSVRAVLQKIGRGVRKKKTGANTIDVVDFADATHKWLSNHSLERIAIYEGEGFDVTYEKPDADGNVGESRTDEQQEEAADSKKSTQHVQLGSHIEGEQVRIQPGTEVERRAAKCGPSLREIGYRMSWHRRAA
jgi:superfamily II DNA or RNA helicase